MYVKPGDKAPAINPLSMMGSGPAAGTQAPETPTDPGSSGADVVSYSSINDVNLRPGSVGVFNLQEGNDLLPFQSSAPGDSFASFTQAFGGALAASVNMPPEVFWLKFGSSFSAMRGVLILFWRTACIERDEEASDFYNPVFKAWLSGEIAAGRVSAPGWSDPRMRAAWCACTWNGPPMINIDPSKTARADKDYVELGAQTLDAVARNFNGSSGPANRMKNARQISQLTPVPWTGKATDPEPSSGTGQPQNSLAEEDGDRDGDALEEEEG
jgi:hypothetical protein